MCLSCYVSCFMGRYKQPKLPPDTPWDPLRKRKPSKSPISLFPRHAQTQSPLFAKLSAELRFIIYEIVLGDPTRPMHILPYEDGSNHVGHRRCEDMESPYPTWQHACFGIRLETIQDPDGRRMRCRASRLAHPSTDNLLAFLLSCRLIYSEAIDILYTANHFSLKCSTGILAFHSVIPTAQWDLIRHLHISTIFFTPKRYYCSNNGRKFPPDDYVRWASSCKALQDLSGLHHLRIEIIVRDSEPPREPAAIAFEVFMSILEPLKDIKARLFEVEMNRPVPDAVQAALGKSNFTFFIHEGPYNSEVFNETS